MINIDDIHDAKRDLPLLLISSPSSATNQSSYIGRNHHDGNHSSSDIPPPPHDNRFAETITTTSTVAARDIAERDNLNRCNTTSNTATTTTTNDSCDNHPQQASCGNNSNNAFSDCCCFQTRRLMTMSDEQLLIIAFGSFLSFATIQMIFAIYIAHSHAMIGDSSVMMIDAVTYLCNGYSERRKKYYLTQYEYELLEIRNSLQQQQQHQVLPTQQQHLSVVSSDNDWNERYEQQQQLQLALKLRQRIIQLEIVAPTISVTTLLIITVLISKQAFQTIQQIESSRQFSNDDTSSNNNNNTDQEPNLYIILSFSIFNLLLDGFNMYFFTRPKILSSSSSQLFSWCRRFRRPTAIVDGEEDDTDALSDSNSDDVSDGIIQPQHQHQSSHQLHNHFKHQHHAHLDSVTSTSKFSTGSSGSSSTPNLNMCSAYTHVLADTLRSVAVITAVLLALVNDIEPALADATAALIVSFLIALSLIPLLQGLYNNSYELYNIYVQQRQNDRVGNTTSIAITDSSHSSMNKTTTIV